jgi:hypothetical protein
MVYNSSTIHKRIDTSCELVMMDKTLDLCKILIFESNKISSGMAIQLCIKRHKTDTSFFLHHLVRGGDNGSLATGLPHTKTKPNSEEMSDSR